jgi:filamentous hemagglutinin family protein
MKAASLNHVYRLVWSKLQQAWVAVAETTRAHGKSSVNGQVMAIKEPVASGILDASLTSSTKWRFVVASAFAAAVMPFSSMADNNVVAGVVAGDLTVKDVSDTHTQYIHTANVNIVDFYKFGVMKGHQLDVIMPDAARALYRVIGNSQSEIMGTLNSNGSLFLINQNGILFGQGSEVNVGNIVASSLNISNEAFLQGNYQFTAGNLVGNIENRGVIKTQNEGYIVLLGNTVDNSGTLVASNGSVVLGSAQTATLDFFGNGLVKAKLSGDALEATIKNSGNIYADGGFVQMATNARAAAINISGIVEANQLVERDGMIRLEGGDNAKVQVTGQLIAKGENTTGGTIEVTGEQVALLDGAVLDASGDTGGGKVLVGGDYQGKNDAVYNSRTTYIAQGATIKADAVQQGDGGKVIVWADDLTRYYGNISAQGGVASGNGGFVEVSGKANLDFHGKVNVTADNGLGGTLLLDPTNIVLSNSPSTLIPITDVATEDVAFANNAGGATTTINVNDVQGFKELWLQANNDITVSSTLNMTDPSGSVRLEAGNNINVNNRINAGAVNGNITLTAGNDINIGANITTGQIGAVNITADADSSGSGNVNIKANIVGYGGINLLAANITQTAGGLTTAGSAIGHAGNVYIEATTGNVNLGTATINASGTTIGANAGSNGGKVEITANNGSVMVGNINTSGSASGNLNNAGGNGGEVVVNALNDISSGTIISRSGNSGVNSTGSAVSGEINLSSTAGNITTGNIASNGGTNNLGATVSLSAGSSVTTGIISTNAGAANTNTDGKSAGAVIIAASDSISVGSINANGANGNGINKSGGVAGKVDLQSVNGDITVNAITNVSGTATGTGTAGVAAEVIAQAGNNITVNGNVNSGPVTMNAKNNLIVNGNMSTKDSNTISLTADADNNAQGNLNVAGFLSSETGAINLKGVDVTGSNVIKTQGGDVDINASNTANLSSAIINTFKNGFSANVVDGGDVTITAANEIIVGDISTYGSSANPDVNGGKAGNVSMTATNGNVTTGAILAQGGTGRGTGNGGAAGLTNIKSVNGNVTLGKVVAVGGNAEGTGVNGLGGTVLAQANGDLNLNGNIQTTSQAMDAVQLVAGSNFKNNVDASITTGSGGQWTIYSSSPTNDVKGAKLLAAYDYKQYGTAFGDALLGTGNGFVHQITPTVTASLSGTASKPFDGNNIVTDTTGLTLALSGLIDGDQIKNPPVVIAGATFDTPVIGAGKPIAASYVVSFETQEGKTIFNPLAGTIDGYAINNTSTALGSITEQPSPRDDAGLGGLIANSSALNVMSIVSLNPAAGEEDPDAVACPVNESRFGSTPIVNSGVKLPDGVNSNCI